ncbi:MAG: PD-(D/E)XK nuclease family protein, partial [Butyrivibrio sp.]|nr:PD-(D/E)XK nuclease family protein [Butyrivibrio sp.]
KQKVCIFMLKKVDEKVIPFEYSTSINTGDIAAFLLTDLGKRMAVAYRNGLLVREKPFMMGIPATDVDDKFPMEEMILIQGIIDAFFIEDGEIVLLDYKTDKVRDDKALTDRYKIQLDYYKRALEKATGKVVKQVYIYSFCLGREIELNI